jgi:UDP-GlcNAc:undecaprenyl-phosphate GlcNAc-1-phosphate transferase
MNQSLVITTTLLMVMGASFVLNLILLRFLRTLGTKDQKAKIEVRWSSQSKPTIGGISFFFSFLIAVIFGLFINSSIGLPLLFLCAAAMMAFFMGLADDAFNTRPFFKLFVQISCAVLLIAGGFYARLFTAEWMNYLFSLFWIVGMMNSINMLDNMDGVSGGVSFSVFLGLGAIFLHLNMVFLALIALCMAAGVLGFLFLNWKPAKLYMGDSGSQLLGVLLAALACAGPLNGAVLGISFFQSLTLLVLLFLLPISDTTLVTINRLRAGRSPMVGGRDHSTHNLSYLGVKDGQIALIYSLLTLLHAIIIFFVIRSHENYFYLSIVVYEVLVFAFLYAISRKNLKQQRYTY